MPLGTPFPASTAANIMWALITYEPVAAFGLRPSNTTANGGKSLLCPTPYTIKMALLDRLIRELGEKEGRVIFPTVRDLTIAVRVPLAVAVNRTFQKVNRLKQHKKDENQEEQAKVWTSTISQREFCIFAGDLTLAVLLPDDPNPRNILRSAFTAINYFGRRGSFMQWVGESLPIEPPTSEFVMLSRGAQPTLAQPSFLQRMDDMLPEATFDDISVLNPKAKGGRTSYTITLPYQLRFHGANHTIYERRS